MRNQITSEKKTNIAICFITFAIAFLSLIIVEILLGIAPFGSVTPLNSDATIQYVDFFQYFKDVINGDASIFYSFSKLFGENSIALVTYYLSSPFNLLMAFFSKSEVYSCMMLTVTIKIALSGFTFSYFLLKRFTSLKRIFVLILGLSYSLMEYNISQTVNPMWLDGVYMMPLIMLGVYYLVRERNVSCLAVSVALTIIFNWYIAYMACLFSGLYFIFEVLSANEFHFAGRVKKYLSTAIFYILSMFTGLMISMVSFLPTIIQLRSGKGTFSFSDLSFGFSGNPLTLISQYCFGTRSMKNSVSLFCGSVVFVAVILLFFLSNISRREKIWSLVILGFLILSFYFDPLTFVFSGFRKASSYYYRHTFTCLAFMIFLAARSLSVGTVKKKRFVVSASLTFVLYTAVVFLLNTMDTDAINLKKSLLQAMAILISGIAVYFVLYSNKTMQSRVASLALVLITVSELSIGSFIIYKGYCSWKIEYGSESLPYADVEGMQGYARDEQNQIDAIKDYDNGIYRISQNTTRMRKDLVNKPAYNESMAYGYMGVAHYSSTFNARSQEFLINLGFTDRETIAVNYDVNLVDDTLLGVKYSLINGDYVGYEKMDSLPTCDNKSVCLNPYALPMGFSIPNYDMEVSSDNPFEYTNMVFSRLLGREVEIYHEVKLEMNAEDHAVSWDAEGYDSSSIAFYGYANLSKVSSKGYPLSVNGNTLMNYSTNLSPKIFNIPLDANGDADIEISKIGVADSVENYSFAYVNLNELAAISKEITQKSCEFTSFRDGYVSCDVQSDGDDMLYLSVPYENGWKATVDGKAVEIATVADCMMAIPLSEGTNTVILTYTTPGLTAGVVLSVLGIILLVLCSVIISKKRKLSQ